LYIKIGGDDFEYPIWALTDFKVSVVHFQENNLQEVETGDAYLFCTLECDQFNLKPIFTDQYVSLWH